MYFENEKNHFLAGKFFLLSGQYNRVGGATSVVNIFAQELLLIFTMLQLKFKTEICYIDLKDKKCTIQMNNSNVSKCFFYKFPLHLIFKETSWLLQCEACVHDSI